MRNLFIAAIAVAALTIGTSTAKADHGRRPPAYCAPSYGVGIHGYPSHSVRTYTSYRHSPAYAARYSVRGHSPHHGVHSYGRSPHFSGYGRSANYGSYGFSQHTYSPHSGAHLGINTGRVSFHIGF